MSPLAVRCVWGADRRARVWARIEATRKRREMVRTIATCAVAFVVSAASVYVAAGAP